MVVDMGDTMVDMEDIMGVDMEDTMEDMVIEDGDVVTGQ